MKHHTLFNITIMGWALLLPLAATASTSGIITEEEAVARALTNNRTIAGMQSRAEAMSYIPAQAGSLPDPVLSLNALNLPTDSFSTTRENMTQMQVGISQSIPFPGKLGLQEEAARFEANASNDTAAETQLKIARDVRLTWWNLFYLDRAIATLKRNQSLLRQFAKIAESKYKTGKGLQADVLMAQVELSKLLDAEIGLNATRRDQAAQFNALLNRPIDSEIVLPAEIDETLSDNFDTDELRHQARDQRPGLNAQKNRIEAADRRQALAEKEYYPDFKLGGSYGYRNGINPLTNRNRTDLASIQLSMTIPLYAGSKQSSSLQQRKAETAMEQFDLEDMVNSVDAEIERAVADYRASLRQASLFKTGIIPQASQSVASMLSAYQVNKVDLLNLINAQITLYNYETQYWKAVSSGKQALARLDAAVGQKPTLNELNISGKETRYE